MKGVFVSAAKEKKRQSCQGSLEQEDIFFFTLSSSSVNLSSALVLKENVSVVSSQQDFQGRHKAN